MTVFERRASQGNGPSRGHVPMPLRGAGRSALPTSAPSILALQRLAGNRAVTGLLTGGPPGRPVTEVQRLWYADKKALAGESLEPLAVSNGEGKNSNMKWNKGGGASGQGKYNTGFWALASDRGLELHVHFGSSGGLLASGGIAHHFKRGGDQKGTVGNEDLKNTFGSDKVTDWNSPSYKIK